jgi:hypothetical protein
MAEEKKEGWQWVADTPQGGLYKYVNSTGKVTEWVVGNNSVGPTLPSQYFDYVYGSSGSSGTTYAQETDVDGSVTGTPGTIYQRSSSGAISIIYRPPSGGGSTSPTNVFISQNPGALYVDRTSDGSDGYPPGTILQVNQVTGAETVKYRPPSSSYLDPDGNGINDATGLAIGVLASSKSPTGYMTADGTITTPNGSAINPVTGQPFGNVYAGSTGGGAPDLVNGKYIWDPTAKKFVIAPGMEPTGSTASPLTGGTIRISGVGASSGGGGGGGGSSSQYDTAGYRAMTQAQLEREAAMLALRQQYAEPDSVSANTTAQLQYNRERDARQEALTREQMQQGYIDSFRGAVSDVDPAAFRAWQFAQGTGVGGNIANRISEGGNALSDLANAGAAAFLAKIRGNYQGVYGQMAGLPPAAGGAGAGGVGAAPGAPAAGGAPMGGGLAPAAPGAPAGFQMPKRAGNWQLAKNPSTGEIIGWRDMGTGAIMPWVPGETDAPFDWSAVGQSTGINSEQGGMTQAPGEPFRNGNWVRVEVGGQPVAWINALTRERRDYMPNDPGGSQLVFNDLASSGPRTAGQNLMSKLYTDASGVQKVMNTPGYAYINPATGKPASLEELAGYGYYDVSGLQTVQLGDQELGIGINSLAEANRLTAPYNESTVKNSLANDALMAQYSAAWAAQEAARAPELGQQVQSTPGVDPLSMAKPLVPGLNRGGMAEMAVVGEGGGEKPLGSSELARAVMGPNGRPMLDVRPLTSSQAQSLMNRGVPGYNEGTEQYGYVEPAWMTAARQRATQTYDAPKPVLAPAAPAPVAQTPYVAPQPVAPAPYVAPQPVQEGVAPAPAAPAPAAPAPAPAAPAPTAPTATAPTATAPATPAPAAPAPAAPTQIDQIVNTPSGSVTTDPVSAQQIAEIRDWRLSQLDPMFRDIGPYSLSLQDKGPSFYSGYLQNLQTALGIPAADFDWEINKWRMPGLSRSAVLSGTGR